MTAGNSVVKLTAKTALKNNWLKCIAASLSLVFSCIIMLIAADYVSYISNDALGYILIAVGGIFLIFPLFLGIVRFFWRMIFGADDMQLVIFHYFSDRQNYKWALRLSLSLAIRAVGFAVVMFLPAIIIDIFSGVKIYEIMDIPIPIWTGNLYYISAFFKAVAGVVLFFIMSRYYLAPFLVVADEDMDIAEAMHMSCTIAKDTSLDFICLVFSFLGWILVSALIFPLAFTVPYFMTSLSIHARFAVAEYNKKAEKNLHSDIPTFSAEI
ncbi:MAG: hypothetical protein UHO61_01950 [Acutalibacteraceae bacterium]|nr:hypothetical protein [Acutalibacteraceae bacterium]